MFAASSRLRIVVALVTSALATLSAAVGSAQSINFSLNVTFANPADQNSGGTWELVAKSSSGPGAFGIAAAVARISNINNDAAIKGPRALVNGSDIAGFQLLANTFHNAIPPTPEFRELTIGQLPVFPLPPGNEQSYFYGVGTLTNGSPEYVGKPVGSNSIGPTFTSLTSPQGIKWATGDTFGSDPLWDTAAKLASGTFEVDVIPAFVAGSTGNIFTTLPATNTALGNIALASAITTIVRTNATGAANTADYNHNGVVDAGDYLIWRKTFGSTVSPPGAGADGNHDTTVNPPDYTLWRAQYGNTVPGSGAGAGLSTSNVPEPTSCILLTIGALLILAPRRGRFQQ